jgi:hypothetical protein
MRSHISPSLLVWKLSTSRRAPAQRLHAGVDLGERDRAVLLRVALAEHVVVDAVEHQDRLHACLLESLRAMRGPFSSILSS